MKHPSHATSYGGIAGSPLSHTEMRPVLGLAPPLSASVITIWRPCVLCCVALRALSMSSEMAYGSGERPCTLTHHCQWTSYLSHLP